MKYKKRSEWTKTSTEEVETEATARVHAIQLKAGHPHGSVSSWNYSQRTDQQPDVINIEISVFSWVSQVKLKMIQFTAHSNISQKTKPISFPLIPSILSQYVVALGPQNWQTPRFSLEPQNFSFCFFIPPIRWAQLPLMNPKDKIKAAAITVW